MAAVQQHDQHVAHDQELVELAAHAPIEHAETAAQLAATAIKEVAAGERLVVTSEAGEMAMAIAAQQHAITMVAEVEYVAGSAAAAQQYADAVQKDVAAHAYVAAHQDHVAAHLHA